MRLQPKTEKLTGASWIQDLDSRMQFGRIVAGLAWPKGNVPGAIVALGEGVATDPVDGMKKLHLLAWEEEKGVEELLEAASEVAPWVGDSRRRSLVSAWVGDPWHPYNRQLRSFNARLVKECRPRIGLRAAPYVGQWQLIAEWAPYCDARTVGRQMLAIDNQKLIAKIEDAGVDARRAIVDFPSVAALFWAIAECDERPRRAMDEKPNYGVVYL